MASSIGDADKLMKDGEKHANNKTMLFKKSPEWEKAADCYQKAAQIYRSPPVKAFDQAVAAFEKAAEAHKGAGAHVSAGIAMENAGNVLRDSSGSAAKCVACYKKAMSHFQDCDNHEKAAEVCIKAAKAIAENDPDGSIKLYMEAIDIYVTEEKHIFISDSWRNCLALMLRNSKVDAAIKLLEKMQSVFVKLEQSEYLRKAQLSVIVLQLSKGDLTAASHSRDSYDDFGFSKEGAAAGQLIDAFEEGEVDTVKQITSTQTFTLLENQVARLAAKLHDVCAETANDMTGAKPTKRAGAKVIEAHELGGSKRKDDDDEDEDDLC